MAINSFTNTRLDYILKKNDPQSLLLLNYLVRNGSERVVTSSREHIYDLRTLENYKFVDDNFKDQGINVRHKVCVNCFIYNSLIFIIKQFVKQVRELIDFIQDDEKLRDERKKAKKNKDKYVGMSSNAMGGSGMRAGGGGGGSTSYNDGWESNRRGADDRNWSMFFLNYSFVDSILIHILSLFRRRLSVT